MEKALRFDRKTLRGVHRLFKGVHFTLGGRKWEGGANLTFFLFCDLADDILSSSTYY